MPSPITPLGAETWREKGRVCARRGWNPKTEFYGDVAANRLVLEGYAQERAKMRAQGLPDPRTGGMIPMEA
jgi:hypothetical protein